MVAAFGRSVKGVQFDSLDGQPVFAEPSVRFRTTFQKEAGEPHSAYHEFLFKLCKVKDRMFTPSGRALAEARHAYLVGFIEQLQAEQRGER